MAGLAVRTPRAQAGGGFRLPSRRTALVVGAGLVLAALAGPIVVRSAAIAGALAAGLIVLLILAFIRGRPMGEVVIILMILISGLVDIPQRISVGPTTGQGAETIGLLAIMLLVILSGYLATGVPQISRLWPIGLFVLWTYL
ncbi:MAG: hypothetical protein ACTHNU_16210, partial [Gaiellales bacterium]